MARKTNEELLAENKALIAKLADQSDNTELVTENESLKQELRSKAEIEAELTETITEMEEREYKAGADGAIAGTTMLVMTPDEYAVYSEKHGRVMGRKKGRKTKCSIEELRSLINSKWTPKMIMDKHGYSVEDFKQLVWKLSQSELRKHPIKFDITRDTIDRSAGV